ncbi:MAG: O-antigen ligase family protein [Bacteroidia bacterium]|nr:O-antigen ligase family protein [Bacteroidia bacterium]
MSDRTFNTSFSKSQLHWFYALVILFGAFLTWGILKGMMFMAGLPVVFLILLLMVFRLDLMVFFAILVTPFSLNLAHTSVGIGVSLPSEPLMFALFLVFWLKVFLDGGLPLKMLRHPVTILILIHLFWYTLTTLTSSMPLVSFKSTLARFCFVSVFYFMVLHLFSKKENIRKFIWYYTIPLLIIIAYTITQHALAGFSEDAAHTAMVPFYNDHTAYAAVISFFIPVMIAFVFDPEYSRRIRIVSGIILAILITATVLSYTRAAWVGLIAALGCYFIFILRIKSAVIYAGFAMLLAVLFMFRTQITMQLESNEQVSSDDYASHVQSIGNISSDDSNIERLNRWACALRMFAERPFFGFGPGTYMFKYGAFQKYSERSGISTNFAEGGGSHSEYLGPLSEQGFMAPLIFIALIVAVSQSTSNYLKRSRNKSNKMLARGVLLGLVTYWVHGVLNYFLDTEKASVPFWGFIAILVALQIFEEEDTETATEEAGS